MSSPQDALHLKLRRPPHALIHSMNGSRYIWYIIYCNETLSTSQAEQPAQRPCPQPQQLATPTPNVLKTRETMLVTPSPRTNPLAMTINLMSLESLAYRVRKICSIIPPTRRANENDGVLRKPIANATPEGIHLAHHTRFRLAYVLREAMTPKTMAKTIIKRELFSGSCPSPVYNSVSTSLIEKTEKTNVRAGQDSTRRTQSAQESSAQVWHRPECTSCML